MRVRLRLFNAARPERRRLHLPVKAGGGYSYAASPINLCRLASAGFTEAWMR